MKALVPGIARYFMDAKRPYVSRYYIDDVVPDNRLVLYGCSSTWQLSDALWMLKYLETANYFADAVVPSKCQVLYG